MKNLIRKLALPALLLSGLFLAGCTSLDKQFALAVKSSVDQIAPEYRDYVMSDRDLDDDSKKVRVDNLDELEKLLNEAALGD